ncbi:lamin tail domain-containing protein [Candidatus Poseidoniales archaeon]|nr:lamin tail domain-containing protein [Candidatus Poseidoniales archaeon]
MEESGHTCIRSDERGLTAVIEFLSAFTLFLMILTAFMSLAQLEMGSNDTEIDQVDQATVFALDRLVGDSGWYVPALENGNLDHANSTSDWDDVSAEDLQKGRVQTGLILAGELDENRLKALSNVTLESFSEGLGLAEDLSAYLHIRVQTSTNTTRVGLVLFEGGSDINSARMASTASSIVRMSGELVIVTLQVHDAGRQSENLVLTEVMVRPIGGGPEWIEIYNDNSFATSLFGWSLNVTSPSSTNNVLFQSGVISGFSTALFTGSVSSQVQGNATQVIDLGTFGILGTGSMNLLDDGSSVIELRFTRPGQTKPLPNSRAEWGGQTGLLLGINNALVWQGGSPLNSASWNVNQVATPGDVPSSVTNAS